MGPDAKHTGDGYIGKPLRRREDARFVRGQGLYVDDVVLPGLAWCAFVRSPHAHARISLAIDASRGRAARRAADIDRGRLGPGRAWRAHRRASDAVRRRPSHERRAAPGLRARRGASCRRYRRRGRGRHQVRRRGRGRGRGGRVRPAACGHHPARRGRAGRTAGARAVRQQSRVRDRARGPPQDRGGDGRGGEGRGAQPQQQPPVGQSDRAALLSVRLRRRARPLHALCDHPAAALPAALALGLHAAHSRA